MYTVFIALPLRSQQHFSVMTVNIRPSVAGSNATFDIYNAHLSPGGFVSLRLCSASGEVLQDLTERVDATQKGQQSLDIDLARYSTGMYFIVYVSRYEVVTAKVVRIR